MATYILKRKYFSTQLTEERNRVLSHTKPSIQEVLKLIILSTTCKTCVKHWLNHLSDSLTSSGDPVKVFLIIVDNYRGLPKQFNEHYIKEVRSNKSVEKYIVYLFNDLKKQRDKNENFKYSEVLPKTLTDDDIRDLIQKIKYIALCLSKQLNPDYDNWWDKNISTTPVNWNTGKGKLVEYDYLRKIINNII